MIVVNTLSMELVNKGEEEEESVKNDECEVLVEEESELMDVPKADVSFSLFPV